MERSLFFGLKRNQAADHLAFSYCGISQTEAGHAYGPSLNAEWVLHIVLRGSGEVNDDGEIYTLASGDGFLIRPHAATRYRSSSSNPWGYLWFGIRGSLIPTYLHAIGFPEHRNVFSVGSVKPFLGLLSQCLMHTSGSVHDELELNALAGRILATLANQMQITRLNPVLRGTSPIVREAVDVIVREWRPGITAAWVAKRINVDRSHLSRVFHREAGMTIKDYIEQLRLSHAHDLLGMTDMSIADIACECGYSNVESLTRNFRESQGISPSEFRKSNTGVIDNLGLGIGFLEAAFAPLAQEKPEK